MGGPSARMSKHSGSRLWSEGPSYGSLDRLRVRSVWVAKGRDSYALWEQAVQGGTVARQLEAA